MSEILGHEVSGGKSEIDGRNTERWIGNNTEFDEEVSPKFHDRKPFARFFCRNVKRVFEAGRITGGYSERLEPRLNVRPANGYPDSFQPGFLAAMSGSDSSYDAQFHTTRWSIVLDAKTAEAENQSWQESLSKLCEGYWYPLYAYLRRKGYSPEDCQDLVQSFFGTLIEKDFLKVVAPEKGRFRWFLMDAISKYAASWNAAKSAQKRGGGKNIVSFDVESGESRYQIEPIEQQTPESLFERQWALSVISQAMENLQETYYSDGKQRLFDGLKKYLIPDGRSSTYAETAEELDLTETAIKVAIHRLRQKFTKAIHSVVLETLSDPEELDEEVNSLLKSLS